MPGFRDTAGFAATIEVAAERLGIRAAIVEKDYWVTQSLRVLTRDYRDDFIFKGGTSLSKAYHIIQRFSEDVDVLIIPRASKNATHALMKQMASAVEGVLGGVATVVSSETGVHRNVRVQYSAARRESRGIRPDILLEAGIRGGPQPSERLPVGCLVGEALQEAGVNIADFGDLQPFDIEVLHLGRTLMEKLGLVHSKLGVNPTDEEAAQHARHYYDIYQLLGDDRALAVLRDRVEFGQIMESMRKVNDEWYGGGELRPASGWAGSPTFNTGGPDYHRLRHAYDSTMAELYLGPGDPPPLDLICARVAELAGLL